MLFSRPTNDVTELARERNRQAAERTVTAWINASLLLIGFGIVIEEIPATLRRSLPQTNPAINLQISHLLGLGTIAVGIVLLIPVSVAHYQTIKLLEQADYVAHPAHVQLAIAVGAVILFGLVALVNVLLVLSQQ